MTKEQRDQLIQLFEVFKEECQGDGWQRSVDEEQKAEDALRSFVASLVKED